MSAFSSGSVSWLTLLVCPLLLLQSLRHGLLMDQKLLQIVSNELQLSFHHQKIGLYLLSQVLFVG